MVAPHGCRRQGLGIYPAYSLFDISEFEISFSDTEHVSSAMKTPKAKDDASEVVRWLATVGD